MYTSKKPTVFTYCYLYMHGYRASIGAWVPQSSLRAICMCLGTGPSIEAQVVFLRYHIPEENRTLSSKAIKCQQFLSRGVGTR